MRKETKKEKPTPQPLLWELGADDAPLAPVASEKEVAEMHAAEEARAAEDEPPEPDILEAEEIDEVEGYRHRSDEVEVYTGPEPEWLGGDCAKPSDDQPALFANEPSWVEHWKGMPEFAQRDLTPFQSIAIHFRSEADRQAFAKLVGQTITGNTRSLWYPPAAIGRMVDKRFVSAPEGSAA